MCGIVFDGCVSQTRYLQTRGTNAPKAIVLRGISSPISTYLTWIQTTLLDPAHATTDPKSVHYVVDETGVLTFVLGVSHTATALDHFTDNTWPLFEIGEGNAQFIYLGVPQEPWNSQVYTAIVEAVCCIIAEHVPLLEVDDLHILVDGSLSSQGMFLELPVNLLGEVRACLLERGIAPVGTIHDLFACCEQNSEDIAQLQTDLDALEAIVAPLPDQVAANTSAIAALQATLTSLQSTVAALQATVAANQASINSIINTLLEHQACINIVCPQPNSCLPIHYTLLPGANTMVPYEIATRLNFTHKVSDTVPESVYPGPLWTAELTCESNWAIQATANFASTDWCAGSSAQLIVTACGVDYIVHDYVVPAAGLQTVQLSGSIVIGVPPSCSDVHVSVVVHDDTTPFKTVISGSVVMEPA